jgi:hypothetical protein
MEAINQHGASFPHRQQGNAFIFVTWRLADSLPAGVREQLAVDKVVAGAISKAVGIRHPKKPARAFAQTGSGGYDN